MLNLNVGENQRLDNWSMSQAGVLRVTTNPYYVSARRISAAFFATTWPENGPVGFGAVLIPDSVASPETPPANTLKISAKLDYIRDGDVIRISPEGRVSVLFRHNATFNAFLLTERCNSFCVMCSQPPRDVDDGYRVDDLLRAIPMIEGAREICLSGGEPTLLGDRFFVLVNALKAYLPNTSVHVLSNGRLFKSLDLAYRLAGCRHPDLMVGIPLYSDISSIHDFVVQADGAYDETIQGILNLKRCGVRVELRVVIHRYTYERLLLVIPPTPANPLVIGRALASLNLYGFNTRAMPTAGRTKKTTTLAAEIAVVTDVDVLTLPIRDALNRKWSNGWVQGTKLVVVNLYAHRGPAELGNRFHQLR